MTRHEPDLGPASREQVSRFRVSRRSLVLGAGALVLGGAAVTFGLRRRGWPRAADGQPLLRMPFPAGTVVLCEQGNASPAGTHTRDKIQNTFALDLSNLTMDAVDVVAAAPGVVSFVLSGAGPDESNAGAQYGNQVRIDHGGGYETFYAHLDGVIALARKAIGAGERLGTIGRTGLAGGRHLHFSLHRKSTPAPGAVESLPIQGVRTSDVSREQLVHFAWLTGPGFEADTSVPWRGHLYASENVPGTLPGEADHGDFEERALSARTALTAALDRRSTLADLSRRYEGMGADACWDVLAPILAQDPDDPVAGYFEAVSVLMPRGRNVEARERLRSAMRGVLVPRRYEPWLTPYAQAHLGILAYREGRPGEAEEHFGTAVRAIPGLESLVAPYRGRRG
jgi:murein DD-endopeptidase MepM/ murein hydrolase activator NlpD